MSDVSQVPTPSELEGLINGLFAAGLQLMLDMEVQGWTLCLMITRVQPINDMYNTVISHFDNIQRMNNISEADMAEFQELRRYFHRRDSEEGTTAFIGLMEQLAAFEEEYTRRIQGLPTIIISQSHVDGELSCAIWTDDYAEREEVHEMPCHREHLFHYNCIRPWLEEHRNCPTCRSVLRLGNPRSLSTYTGEYIASPESSSSSLQSS
ncbi:hypothetical protein KI387_027614, partial [Taxus chinensis]